MSEQEEFNENNTRLSVIRMQRSSTALHMHAHSCYVLGWVGGGVSTMLCGARRHALEAGSALWIPPGTLHGCAGVHQLDYYMMHVPVAVMARLSRALGHGGQLPRFASPTLEHRQAGYLEQMLASDLTEEQLLERLQDFLGRFWSGSPSEYPAAESAGMTGQIQCFLEQNYAQPISNTALAQRFAVSESTLVRHFTADTGMTPHAYLTNLRVDRARDLLRSGLAPAQAALQTGFCDQSHFTNVFRRYIGVSPGTYAASVRQGSGDEDE